MKMYIILLYKRVVFVSQREWLKIKCLEIPHYKSETTILSPWLPTTKYIPLRALAYFSVNLNRGKT